jgi:bifunctional UDP-N-acetylglucosamine pyrophosphorylase/glucosamine-1-phosphate N-acetyltransferase
MEEVLADAGFARVETEGEADIVILNTCSVREKAEQKLRSEVGKLAPLKQKNPGLVLAVAGCVAQQEGEKLLARVSHLDLLIGPDNIADLPQLARQQMDGAPPRAHTVFDLLHRVGNKNAQGEFYLTDVFAIARDKGIRSAVIEGTEAEMLGVNSRAQLAEAEAAFQARRRRELMDQGVGFTAPETVYLSADTVIEADATIGPYVVFGPGVTIRAGAQIRAFCHIEGAEIGERALVGPFARLRPGAVLEEGVHVGNFCEIKNARMEKGSKVNHLSYVGDARVGQKTNIGAGTITCNYDGTEKHFTDIGAGVFIGSDSTLVAPIKVGDGAYVAAGSTITKNIEADALAFGRARQEVKPQGARVLRSRSKRKKDE